MRTFGISLVLVVLLAVPAWGAVSVPSGGPMGAEAAGMADLRGVDMTSVTPAAAAAWASSPVAAFGPADDAPALASGRAEAPDLLILPTRASPFVLALVGCLCVWLAWSRRRVVALAVQVLSICFAQLSALPRLVAGATERGPAGAPPPRARDPERAFRDLPQAWSETDFVGLLRRMGTDPAEGLPAARAFLAQTAASSIARPAFRCGCDAEALSLNGAAFQPDGPAIVVPRRESSRPRSIALSLPAFARPPPYS